MKLESTLTKIVSKFNEATTADEARNIMVDYLKGTKVKDRDLMITTVSGMNSLLQIQKYFYRSLLKFEGLGVS